MLSGAPCWEPRRLSARSRRLVAARGPRLRGLLTGHDPGLADALVAQDVGAVDEDPDQADQIDRGKDGALDAEAVPNQHEAEDHHDEGHDEAAGQSGEGAVVAGNERVAFEFSPMPALLFKCRDNAIRGTGYNPVISSQRLRVGQGTNMEFRSDLLAEFLADDEDLLPE